MAPAPRPEPVLKDTLSEAVQAPSPAARAGDSRGRKRATTAAQHKLAEHVFYPPEAIERGLEGEVRLLLTVAPDGTVTDVSVASSSGHPILDRAAVRAAHAMGRLTGIDRREVILPVLFRLNP